MRANSLAIKNTMMESRGLKRLYLYMRRADRRRVLLLLASSFLVLVVVGLIGFLFIQDLALSGQIFPGITIDGKAVGGMSKTEATDLIKRTVAAPLMASMVLVNEDHEYKLELRSIDLSVDVAAMVDKAYAEGKHQNFISRMFRRFGNKPIHRNVPVIFKYDAAKLNSFIARIAGNVDVSARSSSLDMSTGTPVVNSSKYGLRVVRDGTRDAIVAALPSGNRRIPLLVESVKPRVTEEDIGYIIVVRQSEHKLYLYKAGKFVDAFACAVGTPEYPTPTGQFSIVKKEKDPTWYPPKSDWAKDKKPIPPGPGNPLGPYWMAIGDGVGIHSTPDEKSLGYSASHGCIRLSEWSAQYIFNRVSKGTPVYIYP